MKKTISLALGLLLFGMISAPAGAKSHKGLMLETIGMLSGQGIYLTYVAIGSMADGYAKKVYKKKQASQLLKVYSNMALKAQKQLLKLKKEKAIKGSNLSSVEQLAETFEVLSDQALAFRDYLETGDSAKVDVYESKRKEAWKQISALLGLND